MGSTGRQFQIKNHRIIHRKISGTQNQRKSIRRQFYSEKDHAQRARFVSWRLSSKMQRNQRNWRTSQNQKTNQPYREKA